MFQLNQGKVVLIGLHYLYVKRHELVLVRNKSFEMLRLILVLRVQLSCKVGKEALRNGPAVITFSNNRFVDSPQHQNLVLEHFEEGLRYFPFQVHNFLK